MNWYYHPHVNSIVHINGAGVGSNFFTEIPNQENLETIAINNREGRWVLEDNSIASNYQREPI